MKNPKVMEAIVQKGGDHFVSQRERKIIEKQCQTANSYVGKGFILGVVWGIEFGDSDFTTSAIAVIQNERGLTTEKIIVDVRHVGEDQDKREVHYTFLKKDWKA